MCFEIASRLMKPVLSLALTLVVTSFASATTLLIDDFNDNSLDSAKWTTYLPYTGDPIPSKNSWVKEQNQQIELHKRGYLITKNAYNPDDPANNGGITITGQWAFQDLTENMQIVTRSDGTTSGSAYETANGLEFYVRPDQTTNNVTMWAHSGVSITNLVAGSLTVERYSWYDFTIVDKGTAGVSLTFTKVSNPAETATTTATLVTDTTGADLVVFHNRESQYSTSFLDNVTISSIPEPSSLTLLGAGLIGLVAYAWRKRR